MARTWMFAITACLVFLLAGIAPEARAADTPEQIALRLLDRLDAGDYAAAEAAFTTEMATAVPADKLRAVWESLPRQAGAARGRGTPQVAGRGGVQLVSVPLHYERTELVAKVAVDGNGRIAGFLVQPAPPPPPAAPAADAAFIERELRVGEGHRALPGTLALPRGADAGHPVPGVVLVHGSGPQDRDGTIAANRPFLDIARGLAERGIASLRYDKRTHARPQDFAGHDYDMDDETTDDAVAAVAALRAVPGVDPARVYLLGHSQGGMLAPRIAARSEGLAGLILLAAPARPLLDLLPAQNRYLLALDGAVTPDEQAFLGELDRKIAAVRSDADIGATDTPMGLPPGYWRAFDRIEPVDDARVIDLPMLLLQGGRDFQVTDADWRLWQEGLADRPRTSFRHYPALNHLGIAGQGPASLQEYGTPGHVSPQLIGDIAQWMQAQ